MRGKRFTLVSLGNGWAYAINDNYGSTLLYVQDGDASLLMDEINTIKAQHPTSSADAVLRVILHIHDTPIG